jgi:hypothetical protein
MIDHRLEKDVAQLHKLKIKLAINKHLLKWRRDYASQIPSVFAWARADMITEVIEEMATEDLLTKEVSSRGALIIVYKEAPTGS